MDFAEKEMKKQGWTDGAGMGKGLKGRKECIRVKIKTDSTGVGFDHAKDFTTNWWEDQYNTNLNKLRVGDKAAAGVPSPDPSIAEKKRTLYGRFVKAATLQDNMEVAEDGVDSDNTDEEKETAKQVVKIVDLTDEQMLKACGGRTAHKAARHGHKLNGKLARIAQQEAEEMADNTHQKESQKSKGCHIRSETEAEVRLPEQERRSKKDRSKKNKKRKLVDIEGNVAGDATNDLHIAESSTEQKNRKQKKKQKRQMSLRDVHVGTSTIQDAGDAIQEVKRKKKRKTKTSTVQVNRS